MCIPYIINISALNRGTAKFVNFYTAFINCLEGSKESLKARFLLGLCRVLLNTCAHSDLSRDK